MIIIGLGHKARQGKDYVSNYMMEAMPSSIKLYSFAKALKEYCKANHDTLVGQFRRATGFSGTIEHKDDAVYGYTRILQWYGTFARETNPNIWVDLVAASIEKDQPDIAIITDVRFPNEAAFVKDKNGYTVECIRRQADGSQYTDPGRDPNHISETALNDYNFDFIITVRDGDLPSLKAKALAVLSDVLQLEAEKLLGEHPDWTVGTTEQDFDGLEALAVPDATGFPE